MITPLFTASQDESFVILHIRLKYIKVAEIEYLVSTNSFTIFSKPYYLRLEFQEDLDEEEGKHRASYDYEEGMLTVLLPKLQAGTYFHNLDMQTSLLGRRDKKTVQTDGPALVEELAERLEEEDFEWDWQQEYPGNTPVGLVAGSGGHPYGFNGMFSDLVELEAIDIPEPGAAPSERTAARVAREAADFRPEHYMADLMGDDVAPLLTWQPPTAAELRRYLALKKKARSEDQAAKERAKTGVEETMANTSLTNTTGNAESLRERELTPGDLLGLDEATAALTLTTRPGPNPTPSSTSASVSASERADSEKEARRDRLLLECVEFPEAVVEQLIRLPNRDYLLDNEPLTLIGLADLLFAYAYDQRTTGGESTVESAWTIAKLSVLLSSLTTPPSLRAALAASVRRSLVYPLYRHWALALACLHDVALLLALGRRAVVRALVEARRLLEQHDSYHCHNRLYLSHYIVSQWLQRLHPKKLARLRREVQQLAASLSKEEIGLDLEYWEQQARLEEEEGEGEGEGQSSGSSEESEEVEKVVEKLDQQMQSLQLASQT